MSTPHNPKRYGEKWPQEKIDVCLVELEAIKEFVVLSGGWAWHFMSVFGHTEYKHIHDHKDIDVFVSPTDVWTIIPTLENREFKKVKTKYDKLPSKEEFRRYEKTQYTGNGAAIKITIDFFVRDVPFIEVNGWKLVEPEFLLSLYSNIHSSNNCFAVLTAAKLIEQGINPIGREELSTIDER